MSPIAQSREDPEGGQTQSAPNQPSYPSKGRPSFGDSSEPLFSLYLERADDEDNKMVERWKDDADGIRNFAGLFSVAVALFLSATVPDLRPSSQDTSAFYLGNIYGALIDPNATHAPNLSPVVEPPPFSPSRPAIWVNSLWFLSYVISLTCALLATFLRQWSHRYIRVTQRARCSPEKRARMRALFAEGVDKMHILWVAEALPMLLHLSVFLHFAGLLIFLFNINHTVFNPVGWWIGLFSTGYALITFMPIIRHYSPYYAPLSQSAWFFYSGMKYVLFNVLASKSGTYRSRARFSRLKDRYHDWMSKGVEKAVEETASERTSEIDIRIFDWTMATLGDDDTLEEFFEAVPGFFSSKLVQHLESEISEDTLDCFWRVLNGFMDRTLSSNSVIESVKTRRATICGDIMSMIPRPFNSLHETLCDDLYQALVSTERLRAMARWRFHKNEYVANCAQVRVAKNLASMNEQNEDWITLASDVCGLSAHDFRDNIAHARDNLLLATLIDVSRRAIHSHELGLVEALTHFDILYTLPGLQHDFCALWNEFAQGARSGERYIISIYILRWTRHLYIALHQGTDAAPTAFSPSTDHFDVILFEPLSYPLCDIATHRPDSTAIVPVLNSRAVPLLTQPSGLPDSSHHHSTSGDSAVSQQVKEASITTGPLLPSDLMTRSGIKDNFQATAITSLALPVHTSPRPIYASPPDSVAAAQQDIPPATTLFCPLEGPPRRDILAPFAGPGISEKLSIASTPTPTPTLAPVPTSTSLGLNKSLASCETGVASVSNPLLPVSSVVSFSITASNPGANANAGFWEGRNAEFPAIHSSTTPSHPTGYATLPRLRARGLVNTGNMCFVNAVLQLLVHSPPFWNMFRELGDMRGQRGAGHPELPLVDATVRFVEEFVFKDKEPPLTQQLPQQVTGGKPREDEEENKVVGSFEPTYMYDAMKETRQLKHLLDGQHKDAEEFFRLFLDALNEELLTLLGSTSDHKSATVAPEVQERDVSQSGLTDVGKPDIMASSVKSPISRIFEGRSRSTVRVPNRPDTHTVEDWRLLRLNIQPDLIHTIQESLLRISQLQPLQVGQFGSVEASRQVLIEVLPPVLVLHLERFPYDDVATDGIVKINKPVQFPTELEIPLEIMAPVARKSEERVHYKLYGVLYHHGKSAGSGHYTADVLHPDKDSGSGEAWLHIDDEDANAVQRGDVFGGHGNERLDDWCAYMLFYFRTAPT